MLAKKYPYYVTAAVETWRAASLCNSHTSETRHATSLQGGVRLILLIFLFSFLLFQSVNAQQSELKQPVSLNLHQKPLSDAFALITQQTGIRFSYNSQQINVNRKISVRVENRELSKVLPLILPASVSYRQVGKYIILSVPEPHKKNDLPHPNTSGNVQKNPEVPVFLKENIEYIQLIDSAEVFFYLKNSFLSSGITFDNCHRVITPINKEEMNKKLALLVLSATIAGSEMTAQTEQSENPQIRKKEETKMVVETNMKEKRASQVTFVYPLGTDGRNSSNNEYTTSFNIIGGKTGKVTSFELASVFNINKYSSEGVQIAGIMNLTGTPGNDEPSRNVQIAGVSNYTQNGTSTQIGGVINRADRSLVQIVGVVNISQKSQAQIAGVFNMADTVNVQISGVVNIANSSSCQLSTVNITRKGGFQLGVVNVRDTADGISIGLVNIVKEGGLMEIEVGSNDVIETILSFRSGTQKLYGILSAGYNFTDDFWSTGFGLGTEITLKNRWRLNLEGVHYNLYNKNSFNNPSIKKDWDDWDNFDDYNYASLTQIRATLNYKVAKRFKIYAGPTLNISVVDKDFKFTTPYSIWSTSGDYANVKTWIGYTAGIRF